MALPAAEPAPAPAAAPASAEPAVPGGLLITNVSLWDAIDDAPCPGEVLVRGERIELVAKGGFPPFLLPLVTFEALHARAAAQQAAQQSITPPDGTVN